MKNKKPKRQSELISQSEAGRIAGVSPQAIHSMMKGIRNARFSTAEKLANALGCDIRVWMDPKRVSEREKYVFPGRKHLSVKPEKKAG